MNGINVGVGGVVGVVDGVGVTVLYPIGVSVGVGDTGVEVGVAVGVTVLYPSGVGVGVTVGEGVGGTEGVGVTVL